MQGACVDKTKTKMPVWHYYRTVTASSAFETFLQQQTAASAGAGAKRHQLQFASFAGTEYIIKRYHVRDKKHWSRKTDVMIKNLLSPDGKRSFDGAVLAYEAGTPTIKPVAWAARGPWWSRESYFVYESVVAGYGVHELLQRFQNDANTRNSLLTSMGQISRGLHQSALRHHDIVPHNFLASETGPNQFQVSIIDSDKIARVRGCSALPGIKQFFDWRCLRRLRLAEEDLHVYFRAYLGRAPVYADVLLWLFWVNGGFNVFRHWKRRRDIHFYRATIEPKKIADGHSVTCESC